MRRPFLFLVPAAVAALLYARTTQFDFVSADDADLIAGNTTFLTDLRNVPAAFSRGYFELEGSPLRDKTYYRPATIVSFMADAARGGANPAPYHATNVVLHAAVAALLIPLARSWGAAVAWAFVAALVFAVHPLNVQAVAWVAGRNDLLVALFGVLSMLLFPRLTLRHASRRAREDDAGQALTAGGHVACFALALFSKETGLVLPLLAVLQERLLGRPLTRIAWAALACDGVVVAGWAALRARALAGAPPELSGDVLSAVLHNSPQILVHVGKIVAPFGLNVSPGVDAVVAALGAAALVLLGWAALHWERRPAVALMTCWAMAFLLPTLAVQNMPVYEHRAYVPLVGILAGVAAMFGRRREVSLGVQAAVAILVAACTVAAHRRQDVFRDPAAYWTDATRDARFGPIAHVNLGQLHAAAGRPREARREYLRALERDPDTPKAHNNLGVVLMTLGEADLALSHFTAETERHPWNAEAWYNLGLWHELRGRPDEARGFYERALAADPNYADARSRLESLPSPRP